MNGWDRVIAAVVARRAELELTQRELALKAGVAERTVQNLEAGKRPQPLIRGKIERALGWPTGEMGRIASAPEPKTAPDVLAEQFGEDKAARLRRVLGSRGEAGAIALQALVDEFSSPAVEEPSRDSRAG